MPALQSVLAATAMTIAVAAGAALVGLGTRELGHRERDRVDVREPRDRGGEMSPASPRYTRAAFARSDEAEDRAEAVRLAERERISPVRGYAVDVQDVPAPRSAQIAKLGTTNAAIAGADPGHELPIDRCDEHTTRTNMTVQAIRLPARVPACRGCSGSAARTPT